MRVALLACVVFATARLSPLEGWNFDDQHLPSPGEIREVRGRCDWVEGRSGRNVADGVAADLLASPFWGMELTDTDLAELDDVSAG